MIQDDIINELQYIPESKLQALYELIHYFRLGINSEMEKQSSEDEDLKIDKNLCLNTLLVATMKFIFEDAISKSAQIIITGL
jgi:hypothetical protein